MASNPGFSTPGYGTVSGALPWGSSGAGMLQGLNGNDPMGALANNYAKSYSDSLAMNKSNYNNILSGYQNALTSQQQAQQGVANAYTGLSNDVLSGIQGIGQARNQTIIDQARASSGQQNQQLINRGLGNTTVQSSVDRGIGYDRDKALNQNNEAIAGLRAQYQSQLGQAGIQQMANAYQQNTALTGRQLDWMNSVNAAYPDAGMYGQLAGMYGQRQQGMGGGIMPGGGGGAPGLGYMPRSGPAPYGSGDAPMGGGGGGGGFGAWAGVPISDSGSGYGAYSDYGSGGNGIGLLGSAVNAGAGGNGLGLLGSAMAPSSYGGYGDAYGSAYGAGAGIADMPYTSPYGGGGDF